ncbi:MAG: zinc-ribbon domain-containing protein [Chloroflexi bacterium]|nr:zinc-ribbon domain-containing protein [Chloroflexota bacterium]
MTYTDKLFTCRDCRSWSTFTAGEQESYASKAFTNEPGRCLGCFRS